MASDFESRVRKTGLWLYELVEGETPSVFDKRYWTGKFMEWCMSHNDFKEEMFRFIVPRNVAENTLRRGFAPMEEMEE